MDRLTLVAVLGGTGLLLMSMAGQGGLPLFWNPPSLGIVVGGTLAALCVQYSLSQIRAVARAVADTYFTRPPDVHVLIEFFVHLVVKTRGGRFLALEEDIRQVQDRFLRRGLQLVVDFTPADVLRERLARELMSLADRYRLGYGLFRSMAVIAPGFGMLGTLIGLIQMLSRLEDPTRIGPGLALALLTTFYGALVANLVALPVAGKLRLRGEEELRVKTMMLEGLVLLANGTSPGQMREALRVHLSPFMRQLLTPAGPEAAGGRTEESAGGSGTGGAGAVRAAGV